MRQKKTLTQKTTKTKGGKSEKKTRVASEQFAEYVAKRAYYIWQESGQPQDADMDIWLKAERDISSKFIS